jgi:hypothetical protein
MARFKAAKGGKKAEGPKPSALAAIPCLVVVLLGLALVFALMYFMFTSQGAR